MSCVQCGSPLPKFKHKFCSATCRHKYEWRQKHPLKEKEKGICPECKQEFEKNKPFQKYCSIECRQKANNREWREKHARPIPFSAKPF